MHEFPPEIEARMRAESKRFKEALPKRIEEKPELHFGNALYLNAWFDMDTERNRARFQRITRSMCFQYADDYDLDDEQQDDLWFFISRMDQAFLDWWIKKQPKKREPQSGKNARRPR